MKRMACLLLCVCMAVSMSGCCVSTLTAKVLEETEEPLQRFPQDAQATSVFEIRDENGAALIDGSDLESASALWYPDEITGETVPVVTITFTTSGEEAFYQATLQNIGKCLYIYVDGELITAPSVATPIDGGEAVISGGDIETYDDALTIADAINRSIP